jgi:hypothetical protein
MVQLKDIPTSLAWSFTHVLPGTFKRNKAQFAHLDYPILAPLPHMKTKTQPIEPVIGEGPFVYFVVDASQRLCYIGKTLEKSVFKRWIRPGNVSKDVGDGARVSHYWSHSIKGGGTVFNIADGLHRAKGPYNLYVTTLESLLSKFGEHLGGNPSIPAEAQLTAIENYLIHEMRPTWNQ